MLDIDTVADQVLRLDGPYTDDAVSDAAALLSELVRRLNHATLGWVAVTTVDTVVARLGRAIDGTPQLCRQLAESLQWATSPDLAADNPSLQPGGVAEYAAAQLGHAAQVVAQAGQRLAAAHTCTARLYERGAR